MRNENIRDQAETGSVDRVEQAYNLEMDLRRQTQEGSNFRELLPCFIFDLLYLIFLHLSLFS